MPLVNHQVEINLHHIASLDDGTLDQCLQRGMSPSAWCPLGAVAYPPGATRSARRTKPASGPNFSGRPRTTPPAPRKSHWPGSSTRARAALSAHRQERIREATAALEIDYRREDWYRLLEARRVNDCPDTYRLGP